MADPPDVTLTLRDLTPRFLAFHDAASTPAGKPHVGPDARWALWQEHYGFAAVPPTPEGQALTRALLDAAWPRYGDILDVVRAGADGMAPAPEPLLRRAADLLGCTESITVTLVVFVGAFEGNAFSMRQDGVPVVCVPIEMSPDVRERVLIHEFTHAVHIVTADFTGSWERPLAELVLQEGLATRATAVLCPGEPERAYLGLGDHAEDDRWLAHCRDHLPNILSGVRASLSTADSDTVSRFIYGEGATGVNREAYYAGWAVVGHLLDRGATLSDLAHLRGADIVSCAEHAIEEMLAD